MIEPSPVSNGDHVEEVPVVPVGVVQGMKNELASREAAALGATPDGMEFVGWMLDGWVASYTLYDPLARPVYAFTKVTDAA